MPDHRHLRELHPPSSRLLRPQSGASSRTTAASHATRAYPFGKDCPKAIDSKPSQANAILRLDTVGNSWDLSGPSEAPWSTIHRPYMVPHGQPHISSRSCLYARRVSPFGYCGSTPGKRGEKRIIRWRTTCLRQISPHGCTSLLEHSLAGAASASDQRGSAKRGPTQCGTARTTSPSGPAGTVMARRTSPLPLRQGTTKRRTGLQVGEDQNRRSSYIQRGHGHYSAPRNRLLTTRLTVNPTVQSPHLHPYETRQIPAVAK